VFGVQRDIADGNSEPLMAVLPGVALDELWQVVGIGENALLVVSGMVVIVGLAGLVSAILASLGERRRELAVLRSVGARPGDVVAVSGRLGAAAAGLRLLFAEAVDVDGVPDRDRFGAVAAAHPDLVGAQLRPRPPVADGPLAADAGATAMLDLSDGLALDARRVAEASGVAIDLERSALGDDPLTALTGGEDHGLLACFPPGAELPGGFRRVGTVREGAGLLVDGHPFDERGGWDPYLEWDGAAG